MIPIQFPEANTRYGPPPDLAESQCMTIHAYQGTVERGSVEGAAIVVVAWKPSPQEIEAMLAGKPIFLSCLGGLPPHFLSTDFETAINPT
jgi:hypothetical protein